jgi:AcrR family transcriptional regulator
MNLIDEKGVDGFTILELSARAEVAQKTLYNAYGDKQTIIANAIDHSMRHLGETFPPIAAGDIDGILLQLDKMCVRFLKRPKLVRATSLLYFSHSLDPRVHASLRSMALRYLSPCLRLYEQRGQLLPWVPIGIIENQFANLAHSIDHDWATGRISDQDFPTAINFALLSTLAAVVKDPLRARLCAPLARLSAALSRRGLVSKAAKQKTRPARRTRQR